MKEVKSVTFTAQLHEEGSWGARDIGKHECEMTLYISEDQKAGAIDWTYGENGFQGIGLSFNSNKELIDYDGIFSLPQEAIQLIRDAGFTVGEDFE